MNAISGGNSAVVLLILRILFLLAPTAVVMEGVWVCRSQGVIKWSTPESRGHERSRRSCVSTCVCPVVERRGGVDFRFLGHPASIVTMELEYTIPTDTALSSEVQDPCS
jgi:hypothetical protein